jgi:Flp pilus assembly pilin Flp
MSRLRTFFQEIFADERGATMADYAVLLMILTLALIATVGQMSQALIGFFNRTASTFGGM